MAWRLAALAVLSFAIFLSFSRAAWGLYALCMALLVFLMLLKGKHPPKAACCAV